MQILRVIDSLQLTAQHSVATPVNWQPGDDVMVTPNLTDEEAKQQVCELCIFPINLLYHVHCISCFRAQVQLLDIASITLNG